MTEKEKMLAGEVYNSRDPELIDMYYRARKLLKAYHELEIGDVEGRNEILNQLFGHKGEGVWIETPFFCDYGENIFIGEETFMNTNCILLDDNYIRIGENCLIGPYVQVYTAAHPLKAAERVIPKEERPPNFPAYMTSSLPVTIGDNAWIGGNTVIMPGVSIGNNVTIGASSLVTKDIPDNVLAFGNPCKVVKKL
ncbi:MAG: sugar O-acetyltransferase [Bacteroidota bacterium]